MLSKYLFIALALVFSGTSLADSISTSGERIIENPVSGGSTKLRVNNGGTKVDGLTVSSTGAVAIKGTATNDDAAAGAVGEYVEAVASGDFTQSSPTHATFYDVTGASIVLSPGDWDIQVKASLEGQVTAGASSVARAAIRYDGSQLLCEPGSGINLGTSGNSFGLPSSAIGFVSFTCRAKISAAATTGQKTFKISIRYSNYSGTATYTSIATRNFGSPGTVISARRVR